ncbi:MAG: hypothetical protein ACE5JE_07130 [Thermoplasmata archaeon]
MGSRLQVAASIAALVGGLLGLSGTLWMIADNPLARFRVGLSIFSIPLIFSGLTLSCLALALALWWDGAKGTRPLRRAGSVFALVAGLLLLPWALWTNPAFAATVDPPAQIGPILPFSLASIPMLAVGVALARWEKASGMARVRGLQWGIIVGSGAALAGGLWFSGDALLVTPPVCDIGRVGTVLCLQPITSWQRAALGLSRAGLAAFGIALGLSLWRRGGGRAASANPGGRRVLIMGGASFLLLSAVLLIMALVLIIPVPGVSPFLQQLFFSLGRLGSSLELGLPMLAHSLLVIGVALTLLSVRTTHVR